VCASWVLHLVWDSITRRPASVRQMGWPASTIIHPRATANTMASVVAPSNSSNLRHCCGRPSVASYKARVQGLEFGLARHWSRLARPPSIRTDDVLMRTYRFRHRQPIRLLSPRCLTRGGDAGKQDEQPHARQLAYRAQTPTSSGHRLVRLQTD
jgi:hypothetical protein